MNMKIYEISSKLKFYARSNLGEKSTGCLLVRNAVHAGLSTSRCTGVLANMAITPNDKLFSKL